MASAIASMVAACVAALVVYTGRSFAGMANYVSLDRKSRNALDVMSQQIRQANILTDYSTTSLTFQDYDGGALKYTYDPNARTLTRYKNNVADAKALLTECDYLGFAIYQRNPVAGTYGVYPTATPSTCKLVQMTWVCSRQVLGAKINTESVQSAKIVIRKE